jgi:hypothetical protein
VRTWPLAFLLTACGPSIEEIAWIPADRAFLGERWVLAYRDLPDLGSCVRFERGSLLDQRGPEGDLRLLLGGPRTRPLVDRGSARGGAGALALAAAELGSQLVWVLSPDRRVREPIRYSEGGVVLTAAQLEQRLLAICERHGLTNP